jgi:hypothetical protein
VTYGGRIRLLAWELGETAVEPGEALTVRLYWQALAPVEKDYSVYIHLFGWRDQRLGQRDSYPGGGMLPTTQWASGDIICDTFHVPVREDAVGPVAARLVAGLYDVHTMQNLSAVDDLGLSVGRPVLTRVKIVVPTEPASPSHIADAVLGGCVRLTGYDLPETPLRVGQELPLTLYWQPTAALARDYTVFVHLLDETGTIVGQGDGPPLRDDYPTSYWGAGENLVDTHAIRMRPGIQPGTHRIIVGLYDPDTGYRLPIVNNGHRVPDDALSLAEIDLED